MLLDFNSSRLRCEVGPSDFGKAVLLKNSSVKLRNLLECFTRKLLQLIDSKNEIVKSTMISESIYHLPWVWTKSIHHNLNADNLCKQPSDMITP